MKIQTTGRSLLWFCIGATGGFLLEYLLDPAQGKRRRSLIRDKGIKMRRETMIYGRRVRRNLRNRAQGVAVKFSPLWKAKAPLSDDRLNCRIRSEFGRKINHARSVETNVEGGMVRLTGPILAKDVNRLLRVIKAIHGVKGIINELEVHKTPEKIPGLQGDEKPYLSSLRGV